MMKKNLSVAVVLAVLLTLAVGYALFSQTINITGSATAQGSFSYNIEVQKDANSEINSSSMYEVYNDFSEGATGAMRYNDLVSTPGLTSSISTSGNRVTYSVNFTEPGQEQYFTIKITNTGTIDMSVDYMRILDNAIDNVTYSGTVTGISGTVYTLEETRTCIENNNCADSFATDYSVHYPFDSHAIAAVFVNSRIYNDLYSKNNPEEDYYAPAIIKPNESIYLLVYCSFDRVFGWRKDIKGFNLTSTYNADLIFNQATN